MSLLDADKIYKLTVSPDGTKLAFFAENQKLTFLFVKLKEV